VIKKWHNQLICQECVEGKETNLVKHLLALEIKEYYSHNIPHIARKKLLVIETPHYF